MSLEALTSAWLRLPEKTFSRKALVNSHSIACDCSGLVNLLCDHLDITKPYGLRQPRAVHYFGILQEIGSNHISQLRPWHLLAWRKERVPKSGDSGHVLLTSGSPQQLDHHTYQLPVIDATKVQRGLAARDIRLSTDSQGKIIGVQLHLADSKVKRCPIYHAPLNNQRNCTGCGVPQKLCLCGLVEATVLQQPWVIFRHPSERRKTLSTVSLIKQRYPEVLVKEGTRFPPINGADAVLVFPQSENGGETPFNTTGSGAAPDRTLVLLDATWRKAKRMLIENPWLGELPRISLQPERLSEYLLRKVPDREALSTVEVFAAIEGDDDLQGLFRAMMSKQIALMGEDKYRENYRSHMNYSGKNDTEKD